MVKDLVTWHHENGRVMRHRNRLRCSTIRWSLFILLWIDPCGHIDPEKGVRTTVEWT